MASEITITIWTDAPASPSLAHSLATEAAASIRRATSLRAEAVASAARPVQPAEVAAAADLPDLPRVTAEDGPAIEATGQRSIKRANPVYLVPLEEAVVVETNEGPLTAQAGDFVAYDPISGHVWPVAASYVAQHYDLGVWPEHPPA